MADLPILLTFVAALFVLEITPGPDMMLVLARGIGQGRRVALLTVVGMIFVAGVVQVGLLVLGVASLLKAYPAGLMLLQWVGAAYMLYLGARMVWSSFGDAAEGKRLAATEVSDWRAVSEGTINSLTNPKSLLFMFAFLPQFVDPAASLPVWVQFLILGTIVNFAFSSADLVTVFGASLVVGAMKKTKASFAFGRWIGGSLMIALGLKLATDRG